jgi:hypothetical protein
MQDIKVFINKYIKKNITALDNSHYEYEDDYVENVNDVFKKLVKTIVKSRRMISECSYEVEQIDFTTGHIIVEFGFKYLDFSEYKYKVEIEQVKELRVNARS